MAAGDMGIELIHEDNISATYRVWYHMPVLKPIMVTHGADVGDDHGIGYGLPIGDAPEAPAGPFTVRPQGEWLEFEEPKPYGFWDGAQWARNGRGKVLHTPYLGIARLQLKDLNPWGEDQWRIVAIDLGGKPVECP